MQRREFLKLIGYSEKKYSLDLFEVYYKWCEIYSYDDKSHQILLANSKMFNWWMRQFKMLEAVAFDIAANNPNLPPKEVKQIYDRQVVKIGGYYPKAKIKEALKHLKKPIKNDFRTPLQNLN